MGGYDVVGADLRGVQGAAAGARQPAAADPVVAGATPARARDLRTASRAAGDVAAAERRAPLLEPDRLRERVRAVTRQAWLLAGEFEYELDRLEAAAGKAHEPAVLHLVQRRIAVYTRMLERAHCAMIPPDDPRFHAAEQVSRYCDEADARAPWLPPVSLGAVA